MLRTSLFRPGDSAAAAAMGAMSSASDPADDPEVPINATLDVWCCLAYAHARFGHRLAIVDLAPQQPVAPIAAPLAMERGYITPLAGELPDMDRLLTYSQLHDRSAAVAAALLAVGVCRSSRVAVMLRNCSEVVEMHYAAALLRAVIVNVVSLSY